MKPCSPLAASLLLACLLGTPLRAEDVPVPAPTPEPASARGLKIEGVEPVNLPNAGNAALFVGVNEFEDDSLRALRFAVNDALAQAHLFILELRLIPPANAVVLLTGEPNTDATKAHKAALEKAGVRIEKASRSRVFNELSRAAQLPQHPVDLVIVSLSSHGFEEGGVPYVMPADGSRAFLADTGLSLRTLEQRLERSKAGKRLLIVDACREKATSDDKSMGRAMEAAWRAALGESRGQAVLASCDVGQFSFEDPKLGHGVFTHHLLAALTGQAGADARGFITLGHVSDYVSRSVNEWVARNKLGSSAVAAQTPWFKGPNDARDIPLAVSRARLAAQRDLAGRKQQAQERLADAYKAQNKVLTIPLLDEVSRGLEGATGEKLDELIEQLAELATPTAVRVKGFVGWWEGRGRQLAGLTPAAVPAPANKGVLPDAVPKDQPWINSLGMKFVPVTDVAALFSIWETRVQDYQRFVEQARHTGDTRWKTPPFTQTPAHPVVNVNWPDAQAFCQWLTETERQAGLLLTNQQYRLPTDVEWSLAAGLVKELGKPPAERHAKLRGLYLWGTNWLPATNVANFWGRETAGGSGIMWFSDLFVNTGPVGSFPASATGLFDLGGNVWEWCQDPFSPGATDRVTRGGSWQTHEREKLLCTHRETFGPQVRLPYVGFRCVLETVRPAGK